MEVVYTVHETKINFYHPSRIIPFIVFIKGINKHELLYLVIEIKKWLEQVDVTQVTHSSLKIKKMLLRNKLRDL